MTRIEIPKTDKKRAVILGGGFAGLNAAAKLDERKFQVVLIDKNNFHTFQPLLYQVAGAGLEPESICSPLRKTLKNKVDFHFRMAVVRSVDTARQEVETDRGTLMYDDLIIALGAETNFFGNKNFERNTFPLKELADAAMLRDQIFNCLESAMFAKLPEQQQSLLNFVIVGGGPTGVELAGALAELKRHVLPKDYPDLDTQRVRIHLLEGTGRLLSGMSKKAGHVALRYLEKLGVSVELNVRVSDYDGQTLRTADGRSIATHTVVWAAGISPRRIAGLEALRTDRGRLVVDRFNRTVRNDNGIEAHLFVLGDGALMRLPGWEQGLPAMAPAAIQQGRQVALNLNRRERRQPEIPLSFRDKGVMATVGRNLAVAELRGRTVAGFWGWFLWMAVHLWYLIGFRNKAVVFVNWVISYFTYDRGVRLITPPGKNVETSLQKDDDILHPQGNCGEVSVLR